MNFQQQWIFFSFFVEGGFHHPILDGLIEVVVENMFFGSADLFRGQPRAVQFSEALGFFSLYIAAVEFEGTFDIGLYIHQLFAKHLQLGDAGFSFRKWYDLIRI